MDGGYSGEVIVVCPLKHVRNGYDVVGGSTLSITSNVVNNVISVLDCSVLY